MLTGFISSVVLKYRELYSLLGLLNVNYHSKSQSLTGFFCLKIKPWKIGCHDADVFLFIYRFSIWINVSVEIAVTNGIAIMLIDQKVVFEIVDKSTNNDAVLNVKYNMGKCIR